MCRVLAFETLRCIWGVRRLWCFGCIRNRLNSRKVLIGEMLTCWSSDETEVQPPLRCLRRELDLSFPATGGERTCGPRWQPVPLPVLWTLPIEGPSSGPWVSRGPGSRPSWGLSHCSSRKSRNVLRDPEEAPGKASCTSRDTAQWTPSEQRFRRRVLPSEGFGQTRNHLGR